MRKKLLVAGAVIAAVTFGLEAHASNIGFSFTGNGISGGGVLTYDPTSPDSISGGLPVTGFTGIFSDSNISISNVAITGLVALNPISPAYGPPYPTSMSLLPVTNPPPPDSAISYDNLLYPGGSPLTCLGYPFPGGLLDVYGLMLTLNNGDVVDLYSNGNAPWVSAPNIYGAMVIDMSQSAQNDGAGLVIDNVGGGLGVTVPEPGMLGLFGLGLAGLGLMLRRRKAA